MSYLIPQNTHSKSIYIAIYLSLNVLLVVFALEFDVVHNFYLSQNNSYTPP